MLDVSQCLTSGLLVSPSSVLIECADIGAAPAAPIAHHATFDKRQIDDIDNAITVDISGVLTCLSEVCRYRYQGQVNDVHDTIAIDIDRLRLDRVGVDQRRCLLQCRRSQAMPSGLSNPATRFWTLEPSRSVRWILPREFVQYNLTFCRVNGYCPVRHAL